VGPGALVGLKHASIAGLKGTGALLEAEMEAEHCCPEHFGALGTGGKASLLLVAVALLEQEHCWPMHCL